MRRGLPGCNNPCCAFRSTHFTSNCRSSRNKSVTGFAEQCLAFSWIIVAMAQLENFRLKVFRTVAERLNFRKAAEQLFLTQPAVTLQIKALESDLGVRLFDRTGGK